MSGLTTSLLAELLQLSNEARRKHPEIKEAAERSKFVLKTLKERSGLDISQELGKNPDFIRPFLLACETKHVKLITLSIGSLQKLISHHAIPESSVKGILKTLNDIMSHGVDIQLKILQTLPPLLSNYAILSGDLLAEALMICFRLQDSKIVVVNKTAIAMLQQLVINIFEKVEKEDEIKERDGSIQPTSTVVKINGKGDIALGPCARDAYYLFQDLCLLINLEQPTFLSLNSLSRAFGLELIESVLTNHLKLFKTHPEFSSILHERICPLIIKVLSEKHDFPLTMRLMRIVFILIRQFNEILITECEIFLSKILIKILEPENPLWQRVIAMEIFRSICADGVLSRSIYRWYDRQEYSTNVFRDMIIAFGKLAAEKPQVVGVSSVVGQIHHHHHQTFENSDNTGGTNIGFDTPGLSIAASTMKLQCIDHLDKAEPPSIPETYLYFLTLTCLNSIVDGLHNFAMAIFTPIIQKQQQEKLGSEPETNITNSADHNPHVDSSPFLAPLVQPTLFGNASLKKLEKHSHHEEILLVKDMANIAWPGLLAAQSFFLTANLDEELFQGLMRSYQNFTVVSGVLQLITPRDAFLTSLCKGAVPPSVIAASLAENKAAQVISSTGVGETPGVSLSDRNLSCLKSLLNIAQYLGGVLGDSWYLVLETLQLADFILFQKFGRGSSWNSRRLGANQGASASVVSLQANPAPIKNKRINSSVNTTTLGTSAQASASNSSLTSQQSAIDNDLNILLIQIKKMFENCKYLDDAALQSFTKSLCRLSAHTNGMPLEGTLLVGFSDSEKIESKGFKTTSLTALRGNKSDEKSFAIEKLRLVALLNMPRLVNYESSVIWDLIVSHLIATANYVSIPQLIRVQACESLDEIITTIMKYAGSVQIQSNEKLQSQLLLALNQLVNNPERFASSTGKGQYVEVRKMGLETLNKLLQTSGHSFTFGWSMIFDMIKSVVLLLPPGELDDDSSGYLAENISAENLSVVDLPTFGVSNSKSTGLVRVAFPCLQLICTDFLALLSPECLRKCIDTLGSFGLQMDDLNISLTAIGLLWNVSDFIQTKRAELEKNIERTTKLKEDIQENATNEAEVEEMIESDLTLRTTNALWMLLLLELSKICSDPRPEVRNGANQTLFRTIDMNGAVLGIHTWHACIWNVLFPLLDSVKNASLRAYKAMQQHGIDAEKLNLQQESRGFMVHHSRNTADKQWDETKVLVLNGVSGIFKNFLAMLITLENFGQAWGLFLSHLQDTCLNASQEVANASIKALHTVIQFSRKEDYTEEMQKQFLPLWKATWLVWEKIGLGILTKSSKIYFIDPTPLPLHEEISNETLSIFTQDTLTGYIIAFLDLYEVIRSDLGIEEIKRLLRVVHGTLLYEKSPSYRPDQDNLTPLQEAVRDMMAKIDMNVVGAPAAVLGELADYLTLAFRRHQYFQMTDVSQTQNEKRLGNHRNHIEQSNAPPPKNEIISSKKFTSLTFIAFSKSMMRIVVDFFKKFAKDQGIYSEGVFAKIIAAYGVPMKLKYNCPQLGKYSEDIELWKIATNAFIEVIKLGLLSLEKFGEVIPEKCFVDVWKQLVDVLHGALLSNSTPPFSLKIEQHDTDEAFDMKFLFTLESEVLIHMGHPRVPLELIRKLIDTIQQGSQLYTMDVNRRKTYLNGNLDKPLPTIKDSASTQTPRILTKVEGSAAKIVPVARERFAYVCLQCLFDFCSDTDTDHPKERQRIAEVAAPVLLERCASVMRNYTADQPLMGKFPLPRVRNDEILLILQQLVKLRFRLNIFHPNEDEIQTNPLREQVLSGPIAHLFYLYPVLCEAISSADEMISVLLRDCLKKAVLSIPLKCRVVATAVHAPKTRSTSSDTA
ncbi:hypothetical protein G9A89_015692 [Geosiphon pyriformis]|nr:hypothetical protein G9A89_015692 [Geosiphon pyriformis]